jgi:hypothetical protein
MDPDEWEKVIQVDLNGTFNVTRLACAAQALAALAAVVRCGTNPIASGHRPSA